VNPHPKRLNSTKYEIKEVVLRGACEQEEWEEKCGWIVKTGGCKSKDISDVNNPIHT
jgi:hypothetical protein